MESAAGEKHELEDDGSESYDRCTRSDRAGRAASVSSLLQGLERDGWIERRSDPNDSRRKTLHVTAKSRVLVAEFDTVVRRAEAELLEPLTTSEQAALIHLLFKVDQRFR
jgi:DNA-binding MarR family transcriptional regulator